ncbi:MMPL family transporter [Formicincola oecophyllae]|uniref:MMPL family transporter n=1 Tax=Formicincola oecophyllae TaxID=2558361 RepID=A0A4Y6U819_9PROT|nr:MMPL family transporter [Formicincola oecophyllae]QDH13573.1 MMPL family transporter [Formicincola oecophyllae]
MLSALTDRINAFSAKHAKLVLALAALLIVLSCVVSAHRLGIITDTDKLFAEDLPWRQESMKIERLFPGQKDSLVAVISGDIPEERIEAARQLTAVLSHEPKYFLSATAPGDNPFYNTHGLLFLEPKQLDDLLNSIIAAQPFLGTMAANPSAVGLFQTFDLIALGLSQNQPIPSGFTPALEGFAKALDADVSGHPQPLSWQNLLAGNLAKMGGDYSFVLTHPRQNFASLEPSEDAVKAMRAAFNNLPLAKAGAVHCLITGDDKLNDEELSTVADGMGVGLALSFALVALWLSLAVRSWRIVVAILGTLLCGLVLTTGFAALLVGTLNLISIAFAILFVGIAVDFAIQYSVRFRSQDEPNGQPLATLPALISTGRECSIQILVAALATAAGFMAFIPTSFVGVAQLGKIAGGGMLIAFACTLTVLPALLMVLRAKPAYEGRGFEQLAPVDGFLRRHRWPVLGVFGLLAVLALALSPRLEFDSDPLHTKNPHTEGMEALKLLEQNPITTPYFASALAPDYATAQKWAAAFSKLPSVDNVMWLGALVPDNQQHKLEAISDAADLVLPTLAPSATTAAPTAAEIRAAATKAAKALGAIPPQKLGKPLEDILHDLDKLEKAPDNVLLGTSHALTVYLPDELAQLRDVLTPKPITLSNIPADVRRDYVAPDGEYLINIYPKGDMTNPKVLHNFVKQLETVTPVISGPAMEIAGAAQTITHAFAVAAACAIIAIAIILFAVLRHFKEMMLVMATLLLSALLTLLIVVVVPLPLNFANIIALPLLLGVGVSFNVYFVMNWAVGAKDPLTSPTARAVMFSALTTASAFGTLAFSAHPGTASMGMLLLISLGCTLLCTFLFLPALLPSTPPAHFLRSQAGKKTG